MKNVTLLFSGMLLLAASCGQPPKGEGDPEKSAMEKAQEVISDTSIFNFKTKRRMLIGDPLPANLIQSMGTEFNKRFVNNNINAGFNFPELRAKYALVDPYLRISNCTNSNDTAISMHYILVGNYVQIALNLALNNTSITKLGIYENNVLQPGKYLLIGTNGESVTAINEMTFQSYSNAFKQNIKVGLSDTNVVLPISNIASFPRQTLILKRQFRDLVAQNNNDNDYLGDPYLGISWGGKYSDVGYGTFSADRCIAPSPITFVVKGGLKSHLRPGYQNNDPNERYDKRALNLGRLCPPDCN